MWYNSVRKEFSTNDMIARSIRIIVITLTLSSIDCDKIPTKIRHDTRQPRIQGGLHDSTRDHPYIVSVRKDGKHVCGGTIYSDNIILTSAHCIQNNPTSGLTVKAGSSNLQTGGTIYEVIYAHPHEDHTFSNNGCNDVALLRLNNSIKLDNKTTQVVELFERMERLNDSAVATAVGWGRTHSDSLLSLQYLWYLIRYPFNGGDKSVLLSEHLKSVKLHTMSHWECKKISNWCVEDFICTNTPGNVTCKGDSGGPLMVLGRQAGIATASGGCGISEKKKHNAVFTSIALFRDWIDANAKILSSL